METKSQLRLQTASWIAVYVGIGWVIGQATQDGVRNWYPSLEKPPLNPPNLLFPIVWTTLFVLMGLAGSHLFRARGSATGKVCLALFAVQSAMNWSWSFIFFEWHSLGLAFAWILAMVGFAAALILKSWNHQRMAALCFVPYLLWIGFASYLSGSIWVLN